MNKSSNILIILILILVQAVKSQLPILERSFQCPIEIQATTSLRNYESRTSEDTFSNGYERVVGGDPSSRSFSDYMALISSKTDEGGYRYCSALKIAPRFILSTYTCASDATIAFLNFSTSTVYNETNEVPVKQIMKDPRYDTALPDQRRQYNFAIIELEKDDSPKKYMRLSINSSLPAENTFVRIAAFGQRNNDTLNGNTLYQLDLPVYDNDACKRIYNDNNYNLNSETQACVGYNDGRNCTVCKGDYGGAVIQYDEEDNPVVVGILDFLDARFRCNPSFPDVVIRTAQYASNFSTITGAIVTNTVNEVPVPRQEPSDTPTPSAAASVAVSPTSSPSTSAPPDASTSSTVISPSNSPSSSSNSSSGDSSNIGLIVGIIVGILILVIVIVIIIIIVLRRRNRQADLLYDYEKPDIPDVTGAPQPAAQQIPTSV